MVEVVGDIVQPSSLIIPVYNSNISDQYLSGSLFLSGGQLVIMNGTDTPYTYISGMATAGG